jgi:small redox-active disulfide protein 2
MVIKVLGSGCTNCKRLEALVHEVTLQMGVDVTIEKVTDVMEMMSYRILGLPGLVIDGKVFCAGRVPSKTELTTWLTDAMMAAPPK